MVGVAMETNELYLEIRILISILAKQALHALEQRLAATDAGISALQLGILRALTVKSQTITELSQHFMLDPSTLVPAVDALERKAFARRGRDPDDRRRVPLSLTEQGARFVSCFSVVDAGDPLVRSLQQMGEEQCQDLLNLLRTLVKHMPDGEHILTKVATRVCLYVNQKPKNIDPTHDARISNDNEEGLCNKHVP
jgi:DNA-binding MarR family transcriptional regulator